MDASDFGKTWLRTSDLVGWYGIGTQSEIQLLSFNTELDVPAEFSVRFGVTLQGPMSASPTFAWGVRAKVNSGVGGGQQQIVCDLYDGAEVVIPAGRVVVTALQATNCPYYLDKIDTIMSMASGKLCRATLTKLYSEATTSVAVYKNTTAGFTWDVPARAKRVAIHGTVSGVTMGVDYLWLHHSGGGSYCAVYDSVTHPELHTDGVIIPAGVRRVTAHTASSVPRAEFVLE